MNANQQITLDQYNSIKGMLEERKRWWEVELRNKDWDPDYCRGQMAAYEEAVFIVSQHIQRSEG